jgi:hypothetical protein
MREPLPLAVLITGADVAAVNHRSRALQPQISLLQNLLQHQLRGPRRKLPAPKMPPRANSDLRLHGAVDAVLDSHQRHLRFQHRQRPILPRRRQPRNSSAALDAKTRLLLASILVKAATLPDNANNADRRFPRVRCV